MGGSSVFAVVCLLMISCCSVYAYRPHRWHHYANQIQKAESKQGSMISSVSNITNYGNNLCQKCTVKTYQCNYTFIHFCSEWLAQWSYNGTTSKPVAEGSIQGDTKLEDSLLDRKERSVDITHHTRHPNRPKKYCTYSVPKECSDRECDLQCCDGKTMNSLGLCTAYSHLTCQNGGTLSYNKKYCSCQHGFTGEDCGKRRCTLSCQNGGECMTATKYKNGSLATSSHDDDYCACPKDTSGVLCEKKACSSTCKNGGSCIIIHGLARCACPPDFTGTKCETKIKSGSCPNRKSIVVDVNTTSVCATDGDCPGKQKCCRPRDYYRYTKHCADPYAPNATCYYNNKTHAIGSTFKPKPCQICTCNTSHVSTHEHGAIHCTNLICPDPPEHCQNVSVPAGECCPVCLDPPGMDRCVKNYTAPRFINCPTKDVVLDVDSPNSNQATLKINLHAVDCKGQDLDVAYDKEVLTAGVEEENYHVISAISQRDLRNNFATCLFHVRVRDPYPPVFLTCPSDVYAPHPGAVFWEKPVARDNVGLSILPTSAYQSGTRMRPGSYVVEYWAEDYQGNIARCKFTVVVEKAPGKSGNGRPKGPQQQNGEALGQHNSPSKSTIDVTHNHNKALGIGLGVTTTLLVVILLVLAFVVYRRNTKKIADMRNNSSNRSMQWSAQPNRTNDVPPQYSEGSSGSVMQPPPQYSFEPSSILYGSAATGNQQEKAGELPSKPSLL